MAREVWQAIEATKGRFGSGRNPWQYSWPNDADRPFNYTRLLEVTADSGVAKNKNPEARIAIVGAGAAGLTTARELFRCGFTRIDIYEASDRIGGRLWSVPVEGQHITFEMGAMRMPFFPDPGSHNSLLDHYSRAFGLRTQNFPNPGSRWARTGIFMNEGYGPIPDLSKPPHMDIWEKEEEQPPHEILRRVYDKWSHFATLVQTHTREAYNAGGATWDKMWKALVKNYWDLSFADLVFKPAYAVYDPEVPGDFGGLGMTGEEADIFYVIGAGDGGWGAFFHVAALYPIRTLLFGYATNHQLIQGRFDLESGQYLGGPYASEEIFDSNGGRLNSPAWLGVQSVAEGLFYYPIDDDNLHGVSLYDAVKGNDYDVNLYCRTSVRKLTRTEAGVDLESSVGARHYDAIVLTCPTWAIQLNIEMSGFSAEMLPLNVKSSLSQSHWITSCKVFYPLRERYWEKSPIPQIMMTDSFIQGVYGYALDTQAYPDEPGVLLVSYTWEDDATKLLSIPNDEDLARRCLQELDGICQRADNIRTSISQYVDQSRPVVIHWARQPTYAGCAKLYRARMWADNLSLSAYNQDCSARSGLYFAGDAFSVTSGWVEPALRSAVDVVVHMAENLGAEFHPCFDFKRDYIQIQSAWTPENYAGSLRGVNVVPPDTLLCIEGEPSEDMFLLLEGAVSILKDGREIAVVNDRNVFIGYMSFFARSGRTATMKTKTECSLVSINADKIEGLLKSAPTLAIKLLRDLTSLWLSRSQTNASDKGKALPRLNRLLKNYEYRR